MAVCGDPEVAAVLVAGGACVVLCGTDGARIADAVVALRDANRDTARDAARQEGGRVAGFLGDLADPAVEAAALAMAAELFGSGSAEPVVVRSLSEARQQKAKAPGPAGVGSGSVFVPPPTC